MRSRRRASSISTCRPRRIACGRRSARRRPLKETGMYAFELTRAKTVAEAAAALAKSGGRALAGGQSLVGAMKLRLAQPGTLVDLSGINELRGIRKDGGALMIGAMARDAEVATSATVEGAGPVLAALAHGIGDRQV